MAKGEGKQAAKPQNSNLYVQERLQEDMFLLTPTQVTKEMEAVGPQHVVRPAVPQVVDLDIMQTASTQTLERQT